MFSDVIYIFVKTCTKYNKPIQFYVYTMIYAAFRPMCQNITTPLPVVPNCKTVTRKFEPM